VREIPKDKVTAGIVPTIAMIDAIVALIVSFCVVPAQAMARGGHHSFLGGPWELVVKMGMDAEPLRLPLSVADENRVHKFDSVLPVPGAPIKIRVEQYLPNLGWQTKSVRHPGGGTIVRLTVEGKNLEQELWLSSANPSKRSVSSPVGNMAIVGLQTAETAEKLVRELADSKTVGVLTVWPESGDSPVEVAARPGRAVKVPGSRYPLKIGEYVRHYSIDLDTRKVISVSDKPVNPALKITADDGKRTLEQWIWAKFPTSPHKRAKIPVRMKFAECDLEGDPATRIIICAPGAGRWLLYSHKGQKRVREADLGKSYPLAAEGYSFKIEEIVDGAIIRTEWINKSETLLHPAIVATVEHSGTGRQVVLELNKPIHQKTEFGTMVLLYRRNRDPGLSSKN
jgi:hypothetical protein